MAKKIRLLQKRFGTTISIPHDARVSLQKYLKLNWYIKRQSKIKKIEQFNEKPVAEVVGLMVLLGTAEL